MLKLRLLAEDEEQKASTGKFRAIVWIDDGPYYQLGEDLNTPEEALRVCLAAAPGDDEGFRVLNDKGQLYLSSGVWL